MGNEPKTGTRENHECTKVRSDYKSNYLNSGGISPTKQHSCWVYGPYLLILPTTRRPTRASNREINQKLLTLLGRPSCLTALCGNWRTGCSLGFLRTASQSEAVIWGHMTCARVFSQVMLEHPRWRGCQPNLRFFHPWRNGILTQR